MKRTALKRGKPLQAKKPMRKRSRKRASYMASQARQDGLAHILRKNAMGQQCTLRLSCCNHNTETTVLCHLRRFGWAGMAQKPNDMLAVFACSDCHDALDMRRNDVVCSDTEVLRALGETLMIQLQSGIIRIKGND